MSGTAITFEKVGLDLRSGFLMRRRRVLADLELRIETGSLCGVVGPNGAGKTTLLSLIAGLRKPTQGSVLISGVPATRDEAKRGIGFLPERPYFPEHLTARQLLTYVGALSELPRAGLDDRIAEVLKRVGLEKAERQRLRSFSKGMLQRIGIAQLLLHDSRILVLDEPMSGLDPFGRDAMRTLILEMSSEGRTIILSTHTLSDVDALCSDVVLLDQGRIVYSGPLASLPGTGARVVLDLEADPVDALAQELVALGAVVRKGRWPAVETGTGNDLTRVLAPLLASGARIRSVRAGQTSLEALYLSLKGGPR